LLLAEGFVEKSNPSYKLTEKGRRLLEKLRELSSVPLFIAKQL